MFYFSNTSLSRLETCHSDLQILFKEIIKTYDCTIVDGHRNEGRQTEYYNSGKSQVKYPHSKHNSCPSKAVDAAPYEVNKIDWTSNQMTFFAGYVIGIADKLYEEGKIQHRIKSGLDWDKDNDIDDTTFHDHPHFEIIE